MKSSAGLFNGILILVAAALAGGCTTSEDRILKKQTSTLRVHVEADAGVSDRSSAVSIHRAKPMLLNVDREVVLDERDVANALLVDQPGDLFAVEINFNSHGARVLERISVVSRGRRMAIFSEFGEARWLAAPVIAARNTSGRIVFTPDATREEAQRFVRGLNNLVRKMERKENWPFPAPLER